MCKVWWKSLLALSSVLAVGSAAQAGITPPETQDTFVYSFLSTTPGSVLSAFFPNIVAVANDSPHSVNSLIEFGGLGTAGVTASQVSSATLTLTVGAGAGFGPGPSPATPVTVDLFAANGRVEYGNLVGDSAGDDDGKSVWPGHRRRIAVDRFVRRDVVGQKLAR